jgi:hypothetical protein
MSVVIGHQIKALLEEGARTLRVKMRDGSLTIISPPFMLENDVLQCCKGDQPLRIGLPEIADVIASPLEVNEIPFAVERTTIVPDAPDPINSLIELAKVLKASVSDR